MFENFRETVKGWKTIIWARTLMVLGVVAGVVLPILQLIDGSQIGIFIPPQYTPLIPLIMAAIGMVTEGLRRITTGPVGGKGDVTPVPQTSAGD